MVIAGIPLTEHLPRPNGTGDASLLLLGGDAVVAGRLRRAGYEVRRHALDTGPLAQLAGIPFTPPVVAWPFPDASYDAVVLLDELALTVREEEALAEAARVLRPGGILLLRVPASGRIAWLDGYNIYRYVRDITRRGRLLPEVKGVGWRRHYRRHDLRDLLRPHFRVRAVRASGIGLSDASRLGLSLWWRWILRSEHGDAAIQRVPRLLARFEGRFVIAGRGYWLVIAAERLPSP
ncbi:MAG: methyltransferase domain-containing protein [Chloroflexia bacterium]|nr:methyltransferase domain-containing protein [Chloroflexia bacterium]